MSSGFKYDRINIELRRGLVLELLSKGETNQSVIAKKLNVSPALISLDVQYLREKAQEEVQTHIQEVIPFEYKRSRVALNNLIQRANEILDKTKDDPKMQLQVINTLAYLWAEKRSSTTDGSIIEQAYKRVKTLEEIQKRDTSLNNEEAVFSEDDIKEEAESEPSNTKITTIDDQDTDTALEPDPEEDPREE